MAAEVQYAVYDDPHHLLLRLRPDGFRIGTYRVRVDKDVSADISRTVQVAVIERDDIRMVVVAEILPVDSDVILR